MNFATCLVPEEALQGEVVSLAGDRYHHLFRVRRYGVGAELRLADGRGAARWGRVEEIRPREALIRLGGAAESNEARFRLELRVAPLRPQRAAWLVEKATEIGVFAIRWLESERAGREVTRQRLGRLRRVAAAAVEQCHRSLVPEISGPHAWLETIESIAGGSVTWFLDTAARDDLEVPPGVEAGVLLVGPEGGWSERERRDLSAAGAVPVGLGPRQLRVETAAVAGAAQLLSGWRS